jgi:leader peptidase (prepilin peptidase)/N-methyltransferase
VVLEVLAWLSLVVIGARLCVVDIAEHRLPNRDVLLLAILSTTFFAGSATLSSEPGRFVRALVSGVLCIAALLALALLVPSGLGMGDVKLGFVTGLFLGWLGWEWVYWGTLLGFALGALFALFVMIRRRGTWSTAIPFGPCMLLGVLVCAVIAAV